MATSGTATFARTRNEIISAAARKIGAIRAGETMGAQMLTDFDEALNALVKHWQGSMGLHVWTVEEATLFPQVDQARYEIGASGTDHVTDTYTDYTRTTLSAAEASGQTVLSLTATTGMATSDKIGIELDDGTIQWTTVSSFNSTTATVAVALTSAAASGNAVYYYTNRIVRPLKIVAARRFDPVNNTETPIEIFAHLDYQNLPRKSENGEISVIHYDPRRGTNGYLYIWQTPSAVSSLIRFTYHRPIEDFSAAGDNPDLPQEWILALQFNLALVMAVEYSVPPQKFEMIAAMAGGYLDQVSGSDREPESLFMQPDMGM